MQKIMDIDVADVKFLKDEFLRIEALYEKARYVTEQLKLIKTNAKTTAYTKLKTFREQANILAAEDVKDEDIELLDSLEQTYTQRVAPNIRLPAITVATEDFVPDSQLYYIKSTNKFAVRILGQILSGNVGTVENTRRSSKIFKCQRVECDKMCGRKHPGDHPRWLNNNWMYSNQPIDRKNKNMRHIGSRTSLYEDIFTASKTEIDMRYEQLMHDLLITLCIIKIHPY